MSNEGDLDFVLDFFASFFHHGKNEGDGIGLLLRSTTKEKLSGLRGFWSSGNRVIGKSGNRTKYHLQKPNYTH